MVVCLVFLLIVFLLCLWCFLIVSGVYFLFFFGVLVLYFIVLSCFFCFVSGVFFEVYECFLGIFCLLVFLI